MTRLRFKNVYQNNTRFFLLYRRRHLIPKINGFQAILIGKLQINVEKGGGLSTTILVNFQNTDALLDEGT